MLVVGVDMVARPLDDVSDLTSDQCPLGTKDSLSDGLLSLSAVN